MRTLFRDTLRVGSSPFSARLTWTLGGWLIPLLLAKIKPMMSENGPWEAYVRRNFIYGGHIGKTELSPKTLLDNEEHGRLHLPGTDDGNRHQMKVLKQLRYLSGKLSVQSQVNGVHRPIICCRKARLETGR